MRNDVMPTKAEEWSGEVWIQPDQSDLAGGDLARKERKTPDFRECESECGAWSSVTISSVNDEVRSWLDGGGQVEGLV